MKDANASERRFGPNDSVPDRESAQRWGTVNCRSSYVDPMVGRSWTVGILDKAPGSLFLAIRVAGRMYDRASTSVVKDATVEMSSFPLGG